MLQEDATTSSNLFGENLNRFYYDLTREETIFFGTLYRENDALESNSILRFCYTTPDIFF